MGTEYTNDKALGDYIIGQATGASYNFHSSLGAANTYRPPPVSGPVFRQSPAQRPVFPAGPVITRPELTPQQRAAQQAELARRRSNQRIVAMQPGFFQRIRGRVYSYLDPEGRLLVDSRKELRHGRLTAKREHLEALRKAYRMVWEKALADSRQHGDQRLERDAEERLKLLSAGRFLSPVGRMPGHSYLALQPQRYGRRKRFFRTKVVSEKIWPVGIDEYDKRFREFFRNAYGGSYGRFNNETSFTDLTAQRLFFYYLMTPRTFIEI